MEIRRTALPRIGTRHDFTTRSGQRLGVVCHRDGRRDLVIYDPDDADLARETVELDGDEANAVGRLLGTPCEDRGLGDPCGTAEEPVSVKLTIGDGSPYAGRSIGEARVRTRTGASVVAVARAGSLFISPAPDFVFAPGDLVVVMGSTEGISAAADILARG
ncbi:potassium transporter TrkA [Nonomuraea terrae]|uniref:Potassium transporter TrkA n=1 Tax=Nonomuraea terrae TaxID=2530383 RepID=A0A4R4YP88_9ACTN|nr:TrkA C-terminal domain-containing protein [Nonomuraea terrae]TDD46945.1 potassium transporter TrkA [Nonomuraea terrae]